MRELITSASSKEELQKKINEHYYSVNNYIITDDNRVYNKQRKYILDNVKIQVRRNRWRLLNV